MPNAPPRLCHCGGRVESGKCNKCGPRKRTKVARSKEAEEWRKWYRTSRWTKLSKLIRARDPVCVLCDNEGIATPSEVTDHRIPHKGNLELFWDASNLQGLCKRCHDRKSATE